MNVHFFVCGPKEGISEKDVDKLWRAFGAGHPKYGGPREGCRGHKYIFCLNIDIDTIIEICENFDFEISGLWEDTPMFRRHAFFTATVDTNSYNPEHMARDDYSGKTYVLDK